MIAVAEGDGTSYALKADGTVWAWGRNDFGQLGNGVDFTNSPVPTQVTVLSGITKLQAGFIHALALKNYGTVWTWGANTYGQLGNGFTGSTS